MTSTAGPMTRPSRPIGIRINPGAGAGYNDKLAYSGVRPTKFGIYEDRVDEALTAAASHGLAVDTVRFVGEAVVAVVAETREAAKDALEAVLVDYDELPAVVDPQDHTGRPCVEHPSGGSAERRCGRSPFGDRGRRGQLAGSRDRDEAVDYDVQRQGAALGG